MDAHDDVAYEWCLASGWIKLREVGAGKQFLKQWKPRRRGESYTEAEALVMVTNFLTKAGSSTAGDATMGSGLFEEPSVTMANIAASTGRKRAAPDRLEPSTSLRSQATGSRWKRGKFDCGTDDSPCTDRACIEKRERLQRERDEALALAEAAADQVRALRTELTARAEGVGDSEDVQVGAAALQQAALAALDGREEVVVRLRLTPSGLGMAVVVHNPDDDTAQDVEEAEEEAPTTASAPAPAPAAAPSAFAVLMRSGGSMEAALAREASERAAATTAAVPAAAPAVAKQHPAPQVVLTARVKAGRALPRQHSPSSRRPIGCARRRRTRCWQASQPSRSRCRSSCCRSSVTLW